MWSRVESRRQEIPGGFGFFSKRRQPLGLILALGAVVLSTDPCGAHGYHDHGKTVKWTQPNGATLSLLVFGGEYYARTETKQGYTVVQHLADNAYYYAEISDDGSMLIPGETRADEEPPEGLVKHLKLSAEARQALWEARREMMDPDADERWQAQVEAARQRQLVDQGLAAPLASGSSPEFAPVTGGYLGLTIIVQFPDDPLTGAIDPVNFPTTKVKVERYCNEPGYNDDGNTGSVRDYFLDQSDGALDYSQRVTEIVTVPNPRDYYNYSNYAQPDYPGTKTLRDAGQAGRLLLGDAVGVLQAEGFDFSGLTIKAGSRVVATNVLFAGPTSGSWSNGLWPHRWVMSPQIDVGDGSSMYIYDYQITNAPNAAIKIGTFNHENGHMLLGYPDLYDYGGESEGVGEHCLMGSGNHLNGGRTPAPINGYFKDISGWSNAVDITVQQFLTATLPSTGNQGYRIRKPGTSTEYFFVENRGPGDPWAGSVPDTGIAIWHIDETVSGTENQQMTEALHYGVSLIQADNDFDLENDRNRGDGDDLYDSSTQGFTDTTAPDALWWDGTTSGIEIEVLSLPGSNMDVRFGGQLPGTISVLAPNGGEGFALGATTKITWAANITGNVRIELHKGGGVHSVLSADEANDGSYDWTISTGLPVGADYQIRVSSVDTPAIEDFSDANFSLATEVFPENGLMPAGWVVSPGADAGWEVATDQVSEGNYSLRNLDIGDSQTAEIEYTANFVAGTVSFDAKVSSENTWDFFRFYIDGIEQTGRSGEVDWVSESFPVTAGLHTFKWTYEKDSSVSSGSDTAWIDRVVLPAETAPVPEIAVEEPAGFGLVDGGSTVGFGSPDLGVGIAKTFTVRNAGNAPLTGLAVTVDGADSADFAVGALGQATLSAGETTTFDVTFTPSSLAPRAAALHVASNDADENPFDIALTGVIRALVEEEGFEAGLGEWGNASGYDFNWSRNSGGTASSGTGPTGAADGSWYLYTEASSPNYPAKTAAIERSVDFSGLSNAALIFDYHMYGAAMGTLNLDVYDGSSWQLGVWSLGGQQQSSGTGSWNTAEVDLSAFDETTGIRLRLRGVTGSNYTSDIAIDSVGLHGLLAEYSLTYTAGPGGSLSGLASQTVQHGSDADPVEAVPDGSHRFVDWSDGSTENPRTDMGVIADLDVTANFEPNLPPTFTGYAIAVDEEGTGIVSFGKLLSKVTDPEGHSFSVTSAAPTSAQGGTVTLGASSITYEAPIGVSGADSFQVTVSDEHGAATTAAVSVTIRPASGDPGSTGRNPASVTINGSDQAEVRFHGIPGREYRVQRSTDLSNWQDIGTVTAAANGEVFHTDPNPPQPSAYYRLAR